MSKNGFGMGFFRDLRRWHGLCTLIIESLISSLTENSHEIRNHHVEKLLRRQRRALPVDPERHAAVIEPVALNGQGRPACPTRHVNRSSDTLPAFLPVLDLPQNIAQNLRDLDLIHIAPLP